MRTSSYSSIIKIYQRKSSGIWKAIQVIENENQPMDISLNANYLLASFEDEKIRIYLRKGSVWEELKNVETFGPVSSNSFGRSVDVDRNQFIIGGNGTVIWYIRRNNGVIEEVSRVEDERLYSSFGANVSIHKSTAIATDFEHKQLFIYRKILLYI